MRRLSISVVAAVSLVLGLGSVPAASGSHLDRVTFGASVRPENQNMESLEAAVGREFDTTRLFYRWDDAFPSDYARYLLNDQPNPPELMISVKAQTRGGRTIKWADIAAAQPGSALHNNMVRWARAVRDLGVPVFFTFHHEPEAEINTGNGNATNYIAAWRKFHSVLVGQGASNASTMWILTAQAFRVGSGDRRQAAKWYPGDAYVDGIASDAYNWYNCRTNVSTPWRSLAFLIEGQRVFGAAHPSVPLYLTEWASAEDPNAPGRKAQWIRDARALLKTPAYEQFRGVTYFNIPGQGNCVWDVRSSASARTAFAEMGADPYFGG